MNKIFIALLIIMMSTISTSCWDKTEVEELGIVTGASFDKVTINGVDKYFIGYLIIKLQQGQQDKEESTNSGALIHGIGDNFEQAINDIHSQTSRKIILTHSENYIIGEKIAKDDGFKDIIDFLLRNKEIRKRSNIYTTKGKAINILQIPPRIEITQTREIEALVKKLSAELPISYMEDILHVAKNLLNKGKGTIIPMIEVISIKENKKNLPEDFMPNKTVQFSGISILKNGKLVASLNRSESRGILYIIGKNQRDIISIQFENNKQKDMFSLLINKIDSKITPTISGNNISVKIKVNINSDIGSFKTQKPIKKIEEHYYELINSASIHIKKNIENSIRITQDIGVDVLGIGEIIHRKQPKQWNKLQDKWSKVYPLVKINTDVEVNIQDVNRIVDPIEIWEGE